MTNKEIVERAKEAEKRTGFGELIHSPISKGVNSAYGIGFIEGMVEYRNFLQEEPVSEDLGEYISELSKQFPEVSFAKLSRIAAHIAKWQKDNTIRKVVKWLYANFYLSKEYLSETSILPIPKYAHNATMGQFISEFINHMKKV